MRRSLFLNASVLTVLCGAAALPLSSSYVWAQTAASSEQTQASPAGAFIQNLGNKAIGIVRNQGVSENQRHSQYDDLLRSAFDIPSISHFVLGRAWDSATPQQQKDFMDAFQTLMIKIYGDRLSFYSGETFRVKNVRQDGKDIVVSSEVDHPQGTPPTSVDWSLRQTNNSFSIVDVVVEGVSQSVTQRQEYTSILERNNGNMDELIKMMREKSEKPPASS